MESLWPWEDDDPQFPFQGGETMQLENRKSVSPERDAMATTFIPEISTSSPTGPHTSMTLATSKLHAGKRLSPCSYEQGFNPFP